MDLLRYLLPLDTNFRVEDTMVDIEVPLVTVKREAIAPSCVCPSCQLPAERIHSHYQRTIVDLPWADLVVHLRLTVRKFFCDNSLCQRKVFTERLPTLVAPSARRTTRLAEQQQQIGLALGGNPSTRLSGDLGCAASRNTFLRLIHRLPLPEPAAPEVVGVDDWAWRKGQRRQGRLERYERTRALHTQGWSIRAIGQELGLNRNTVRTYLRAPSFPERQPRVSRQPSVLEPFIPYLIERWNAGCRNGTALWKEIAELGYAGKRVIVFSFVTRLRKTLGMPAKNRSHQEGKISVREERPLTPRNAVWEVMKRQDKREATGERLEVGAGGEQRTQAISELCQ